MESEKPLTVEDIILELGLYLFPVNSISNQKRVMRRGTMKTRGLREICHADRLIGLDKYLYLLPGKKMTEKNGMTRINGTLLNGKPNSCSKHTYVQGFDCDSVT